MANNKKDMNVSESKQDKFVKDSKDRAPKGKRSNRSRGNKSRTPKSNEAYKTTPGTNDVSIHTPDAEIMNNSANISWSYETGGLITFNSQACRDRQYELANDSSTMVLPGIMTCREVPSVGTDAEYFAYSETTSFTPVNIAANALLTKMRSLTRVRNTYDAPDIFMVLSAMGNIYAGIAWAKRLYATNNMYSYMNKYLPDALFKAQHIDATPLKADSFAFLSRLNRIISMANTVYVPNRLKWFEYLTIRYSNYYTEGPSIKDQIYMYAPAMLGQYVSTALASKYASAVAPCFITPRDPDELPQATVSLPTHVKYGSKDATTDELLDALERMVHAIINDTDVPDICGDMENAFGSSDRYAIAPLTADVMAVPLYDEEMLETFMNSRKASIATNLFRGYNSQDYITNYGPFWTTQDPANNRISTKCSLVVPATNTAYHVYMAESMASWLLNIHKDPSPAKTVAITRNLNRPLAIYTNASGDANMLVRAAGSIIVEFQVVSMDSSGNPIIVDYDQTRLTTATDISTILFDSFHYRPIVRFVDGARNVVLNFSGELDIMAFISDRDMAELDRIDLMRMFGAYDNFK